MSFEGPKAEVIYEREPGVVKEYLESKDEIILQKMIKESYKIPGIIENDSKKDPESRVFKILPKFSNREIAEEAQRVLDVKTRAKFFAV
jgi:hypothetical protein